jgi:hypothetical protein
MRPCKPHFCGEWAYTIGNNDTLPPYNSAEACGLASMLPEMIIYFLFGFQPDIAPMAISGDTVLFEIFYFFAFMNMHRFPLVREPKNKREMKYFQAKLEPYSFKFIPQHGHTNSSPLCIGPSSG